METVDDVMAHYGVPGMKWGVRRDHTPTSVQLNLRPGRKVKTKGGKYQPPSEDAVRVAGHRQKARKSTTDSLSTKELQELVNRMNLEQQYSRLDADRGSVGLKVAKTFLQNGGGELAVSGLTKGAVSAGIATNPAVATGLAIGGVIAKATTGKKKK